MPGKAFWRLQNARNRLGGRGGPRWESLQRSPDPLADGEGAGCPLSKNLTPALGLFYASPVPTPIFNHPPNENPSYGLCSSY